MIGLLFFINFTVILSSNAIDPNNKLYQVLRDLPSKFQNTETRIPVRDVNTPEDTTRADILNVLHDNDGFKEIRDNEVTNTNINSDAGPKTEESKRMAWLEELFNAPKKAKETTDEKEDRRAKLGLIDALQDLTRVLRDLNKNIYKFNVKDKGNGYMMMKLPIKRHRNRPKREISSNTTHLEVNGVENSNDTTTSANFTTNNTDEIGSISGRRNLNPESLLEVKEKLLAYLNDSFSEIKIKVEPLNDLKLALGNNNDYKIGYVIANVDALKMNLGKLEKDMEINKQYWDDRTILEVFDKLKVSNNVITSLMGSLKEFVQTKPHYS